MIRDISREESYLCRSIIIEIIDIVTTIDGSFSEYRSLDLFHGLSDDNISTDSFLIFENDDSFCFIATIDYISIDDEISTDDNE